MAILSKLLGSAAVLAGASAHESIVQSKLSKPSLTLAQISKYDISNSLSKDEFAEGNTAWTPDTIAKQAIDYTSAAEKKQHAPDDAKAALHEVLSGSDDLKKALAQDESATQTQQQAQDAQKKQQQQEVQSAKAVKSGFAAIEFNADGNVIEQPQVLAAPAKPTTTNEQAAEAVKSEVTEAPGYVPPPLAKKDKPLSQSEQFLVDSALKAPLPMDIGNMLKDPNSDVEKLAAAANPDKPKEDPKTAQEAAQVVQQIAAQKEAEKKAEENINKINDPKLFEPGKSLSITDVISVGGLYQQKLDEDNRKEKDAWKKAESEAGGNLDENGNPIQDAAKVHSAEGFRVDLTNEDGAGYVGTIFMGSNDAPVKVLFDTGSDFLAITSDLCLDPKLGKQEEAVAVYDPVNQVYKNEAKDLRKCKSTAYLSQKSSSAHKMGGDDEKLDYGSAKLMGKLYTDKTCVDANKTACTNFEFLALYQAIGLDDTDGVLGLAVHPDIKRRNLNYVWNLKNNGVIDRAIVSFSIAGPNMDDQSYAIFGGLQPDQIVGGTEALKKMSTTAYRPYWTQSVKQWALEGKSIMYGDELAQKPGGEAAYTAVIDTGSSNIAISDDMFKTLVEKWQKDVPKVDCVTDDNFCQVMTPCTEVAPKLKPIAFAIGGQTFEMAPELYLHQAEGKRCQFAIHSNQLKGTTGNLVLIGDTLLRHLYQVYDFENETISFGINKHSEGRILMFEDGKRPEDAPKIQTKEDNMNVVEKSRFQNMENDLHEN